MKRTEIIERIEKILASHTKANEIKEEMESFIEEIRPKVADKKNMTKVFVLNRDVEIPSNLKVPPQMKICRDILVGREGDELTFDEARDLFRQHADDLHTKQDGFRIFQYYRKNLEEVGVIRTEERAIG